MKLGKKKIKEPSVDDNPEKKPGKKNKRKAESSGSGLKRLNTVALNQALVVVLAGVVAVALLHFLVIVPAGERSYQQARVVEADGAQQRLNQYFSAQQEQVRALANQRYVSNQLAEQGDRDELARQLQAALPGAQAVFVFRYRDIPRTGSSDSLLGFAGLELARRAENGQSLLPDAFPRNDQWYLQYAAPVRHPVSNAVQGSVLVVYGADQLQPLLTVGNRQLGGQLSLVQAASGSQRTVVSAGRGAGPSEARTLTNPDWSVVFQPARAPEAPVNTIVAAVLVGIPALAAAIVVWVLLGGAQRGIRQDVTALIQWSHKVFGGERVKLPTFRWDMVASTGEVLFRLSQMVDKRLAKAAESAKPQPSAAGARKPASGEEEPLFQDKDMPDIDMLDGDEDVLGFGSGDDALFDDDIPEVVEAELPSVEVAPEIFRAYDIRGIVGETLSPDVVRVIGLAIGSEASARGVTSICVGYDGRHSSPDLADALASGIMATGCNVIHVGAVPTPVLYFATHQLETGSGVMVTGSHNPANYNGLKIMLGGETLSGEAIQKLYQRIQTADFTSGQGAQSREDVRRAYLDRIVGDIAVAAPLKVVVDAGNGIAGELGPMLIEELGCEVTPLYCEVDGDFPNHHPDPGKPANLQDLIAKVQETGADIGLAFDGDGDRLGVVTNTGKIIWPDRLLMLFARDVVSRNPGADVLYDVKCSRRLAGVISEAGGRPIMWKSGHSLMKAKMKESGALLAGEMSGHVFFGERWYGFDDGLYSAARLLEILGIEDRHSDDVFADFPEDISTPELNVEVTESEKFAIIERLGELGEFGDGNISTIDGIRVDYTDGWGLCRASNTTPVLVLRFEAETDEALERIKAVFREQLQKAAPDLVADF
ncbi:phosphomannomutase/phosphoglucomutase [Marinobacter shengliensis]|uniref:phosphomannomutase/phosphoglucomutase n=1 Tax=Marinobacter shengliensis TaxID=1389223 RepID=UPI000D114754|nr:phosphomannomutase/phosphoglucomutase [Marinobacter shengliensis]PSF14613.1 phosphomannomutase/phosphoglucomutase [Marinobacter shengliensis]